MSTPLSPDSAVVVVGASLAGLRAAEELRHLGHTGPLTVVGDEAHAPYDRPPLSKQVLSGKWEPERIHHHSAEALSALDMTFRLGVAATSLETENRHVGLADGSTLPYDGLVIATGAAARRLPGTEGMTHVHCLRTLDDCLAVRADIAAIGEGARLVVIGAGFIGGEVAATCHGLGATVTIVEALPTPLGRILGDEMGMACTELHRANGVDVRAGVGVDRVENPGGSDPVVVYLADGSVLPADLVVVGIGVSPNTAWLADSGVDVDNGVLCDERLFCGERIVAAGDIARWTPPGLGESVRIEHWTNAAEGGAAAGRNLLAGSEGAEIYDPVPFFWSDQYKTKIQMIGRPGPDDEVVVVEGSPADAAFVALYRRGDRLRAVLTFSRPRQLMSYRPLLAAGASFDEALALSKA